MRSPFQVMRDWHRKRALKAQWLPILRKLRPGVALRIELGGAEDEAVECVALQELIRENAAHLEILNWGANCVTLLRKITLRGATSPAFIEHIRAKGLALDADAMEFFTEPAFPDVSVPKSRSTTQDAFAPSAKKP